MIDKTIYVVEGSTQREIELFAEHLKNNAKNIVTNKDVKVIKLIKGEMFEVVTNLKKVKK